MEGTVLGKQNIEQVDTFMIMGTEVNKSNDIFSQTERRIQLGNRTFFGLEIKYDKPKKQITRTSMTLGLLRTKNTPPNIIWPSANGQSEVFQFL